MGVLAECKLAIRGERACTTSGLDYMRRFGVGPDFVGDGEESGVRSVGGGGRKFFNLPSGWYYQNMLRISRMEQDFMIAAIDEKAHRVSTEVTEGFPGALTKMRTGPYTVFVKLLAPALGGAIRKSSRMQTLVNQAQLACAIERYRLANGKLPDGLDALTPRFIEKIPNDVIDGQPLRYHVKADGSYALYSIGWNKTDDGGQVVWTSGKTPSVDLTKGDWAWQMPAKLN
jgi:hypothetical protein